MSDYTTIAPFYDLILGPFIKSIRRDVLGIVRELQPERIIDVCCGTGDQLRILQENGIEALGIDMSPSMLKVAAKGANPVRCSLQDATAMAFRARSFDLAMVSFALHETEWEKARMMLQEIHRVLKPTGNLLVVDYEMNPKSGIGAKAVIHAVEFLAGRRHFSNFMHYNRSGGLQELADPARYTRIQNHFHAFNSIVVRLFQTKG